MPYQWKLKYFLGRGKHFRHWQLKSISDKNHVLYFLPTKTSLLLDNCILSNNPNIARKTYSGANRQPCAWVKAENWIEVDPVRDLGELEPLFYNPKVRPYWQGEGGNNIDGCRYKTIITANNRIYGIRKIPQNLFELKPNNPRELNKNEQINPLDTSESIADLAEMLRCLDCAEGLKELQQVPEFTSQRLNQATKTLSPDWQNKIRQWAMFNRSSKAN